MTLNDPTPCFGKSELFDSLDAADHNQAKALCATCPELTTCRTHLEQTIAMSHPGGGPEGTWAGLLLGTPSIRADISKAELAAIEASYTHEDILAAHTQYNAGGRTEWAVIGHRLYERKRYHRRKAERNTAA